MINLKPVVVLEIVKGTKYAGRIPNRQAIGILLYLMIRTRPEISYTIGKLPRNTSSLLDYMTGSQSSLSCAKLVEQEIMASSRMDNIPCQLMVCPMRIVAYAKYSANSQVGKSS